MRDNQPFDRVEDYTNAFLGMSYLLLVMTLVLIWGAWGYLFALALCGALHYAIRRLGERRAAREAEWNARVEAVLARRRER
jgi:flagellar biogenesis protein FliO